MHAPARGSPGCCDLSGASDERRAANCWAIPVLILSIIHIILVFVGDPVSFGVGVLGTVTSSIVVCGCLPTTGSSGCGYRAAEILGIITSFYFFANMILHILWWVLWSGGAHIVGAIFLVIKIASLACTVVLTQKLFKAHAAALRDESSRQPSVIIGSVGSVVEMTPAYEKA